MTPARRQSKSIADSEASDCDAPFVFSVDGHKSLYFTLDQLQSRMSSERPTHLHVDYTRTMMGFLLFHQQPLNIAMIGLGGGSLLKFCYRHLPDTRLTAIEINPRVIALCHEFEVPDDAERIEIVCADGADFMRNTLHRYDVLLVDGFDSQGQPPQLCSQAFYDDCFNALSPQGVMVVNRHHDDADHAEIARRIQQAFGGHVFEAASQEKSNSIFFACKELCLSVDEWREKQQAERPLENFDQVLRAQLQAEFARITWELTLAAY